AETLERSSLGALTAGSPVNLERPMALGGRLDGHLVQGHVDGTGTLTARQDADSGTDLTIGLPEGLGRYLV
ncbi:riboflavin synthase subunit alpha, partial [Streptomyces nanshensis]